MSLSSSCYYKYVRFLYVLATLIQLNETPEYILMADLHGRIPYACPHLQPHFLHFHAVFMKIWPTNRLAFAIPPPHSLGVTSPSGKYCIHHCQKDSKEIDFASQ